MPIRCRRTEGLARSPVDLWRWKCQSVMPWCPPWVTSFRSQPDPPRGERSSPDSGDCAGGGIWRCCLNNGNASTVALRLSIWMARWLKPMPVSTGPSVGQCTSSTAPKSSPENLSMVKLALPDLQSALTTQPGSSVQSLRSRQGSRASPLDHRWITHSRHRTALTGHQRTPAWSISYSRGRRGSLSDTGGHGTDTVRDREARVQIPGPRPIYEFGFMLLYPNSARIQGPHGFQPCAFDLAALIKPLCM